MFLHGLQFLLKGGWVMWPLFLCALTSVTVMIERGYVYLRASANNRLLLVRLRKCLEAKDTPGALQECRQARGPVAAMLAQGVIAHGERLGLVAIERAMEEVALREIPQLEQRLGVLDTIITLSPLLGLLGTISGMISSFKIVAIASGSEAGMAITGGVAEALICTATGLTVAIITLPVFNYYNGRVKGFISEMEICATDLLTILDAEAIATTPEKSHASPQV